MQANLTIRLCSISRRGFVLVLFSIALFFGSLARAQVYTTGAVNWNNGLSANGTDFDITGGVGLYSFDGNPAWGSVVWRNLTADGSLNGTSLALQVGQSISITLSGADSGGRTGIVANGAIGFSLAGATGAPTGGDTAAQAIDASRFRVEYIGGANSATAVGSTTYSGFMPGFADFKSGQTYIVEVISSNQINFRVAGGVTYNIMDLGGTSNAGIGRIELYNRGANMDARFTGVAVSNMSAVNLSNNASETFTVSGTIGKNNGANNNIVKNGVGEVILTAANNFGGSIGVNSGTLRIANSEALGGTGAVTVASGASLALSNNISENNAINISGTGNSNVGAIRNLSGNNTLSGVVTLGTSSWIKSELGTTLNFTGGFSGTGNNLTINGDGNTAISGSGINTGSAGSLTKNDSGTLILSASGNYTGATIINGGSVEVQNASALGSTNSGTTVNSGANLKLYGGGTGISYNAESITLNGLGPAYGDVGGDAGALRSVGGGTNIWNGTITLAASARINSDAAGGAGSLTITGNVNGSTNVLFVGTKSSAIANMTISGALSGAGAAQDGTITSLFKDGASTLTLSGNNSYSGDTRISAGNLTVASGGNLGDGTSDIYIGKDASLTVNANTTVASLREWGTTNGGTASIGAGATLTVAGDNWNDYMNSISGAGNLTKSGTGIMNLYGTQGYTGTTTVSGGKLSSGVALASSNLVISGGIFEATAANVITNTATVNMSAGTFALQANDTVASLTMTGGTLSTTNSSTLTAANYNLNGGTVNANLGTGTVTASSGTTSLNGTAAATTVNVNGGTLNTGGANRLADAATVAVTAGTLGVGGNDTIGSMAISSSGTVNVATGSTLTATVNSSISGFGKATGGTLAVANNANLNLANNANTTTSDLAIGVGSALTGTGGTTGKITGGGLLSAGNSPGILTAGQIDLTGGMDFAFEFTGSGAPTYSQPGNSRNDLLHLTSGSAPFLGSFSAANSISLFFNDASLNSSLLSVNPTKYLGGFYVDSTNFDIAALLSAASKTYYVADANGLISFNGVNYTQLSSDVSSRTIFSNTNQTDSAFDTGTTSGTVLSITMVPEPSTASLLTLTLVGALRLRRRRA